MGADDPQVKITAATLAGGDKNHDRFASGDGWAFVLDGASSFSTTQPHHDGGWYAEHLKQALSAGLTNQPEWSTAAIVQDAIRVAAEAHGGDGSTCPTSTIALARWDSESVEVYLLGDSTAVLISDDAEEVLSDTRLAEIARPIREEYRSRLRAGHGFDEHHQHLLQQLQEQQVAARNDSSGYWIAGAEPEAANQGITATRPRSDTHAVVLASDGTANGTRYGLFESWAATASRDPDESLQNVHNIEKSDIQGVRWPRSKPHDDKTIVIIDLNNIRR